MENKAKYNYTVYKDDAVVISEKADSVIVVSSRTESDFITVSMQVGATPDETWKLAAALDSTASDLRTALWEEYNEQADRQVPYGLFCMSMDGIISSNKDKLDESKEHEAEESDAETTEELPEKRGGIEITKVFFD